MADNTSEGSVYTSQDSGQTWMRTSAPAKQWTAAASSADGIKLIIAGYDAFEGPVYVSPDAGTTWTRSAAPVTGYTSAASSADGSRLILGANDFPAGALYTSSDSGQTWTTAPAFSAWNSVASSADGLRLIGVSSSFPDGPVYTSANGGQNWTQSNVIASSWMAVCCSADGLKCLIASNAFPSDPVYRTTTAGASWTPVGLNPNNWSAVACSADGTRLIVASALINGFQGQSNISGDSGSTWVPSGLPNRVWRSLASSADGRQIVAAAYGDGVYILRPVWAPPFPPQEQWRQAHFGSPLNAGAGADLADPDLDGLTNVVEFAYGLIPTRPDGGSLPQFQRSGGDFAVSFPTPGGVSGVTYGAEWSRTMQPGSWIAIPDTGSGAQHTFSLSLSGARQFLRLKVTAP